MDSENKLINESQMTEGSLKLLEAKKNRKLKEDEYLTIANRVALLEQTEYKITKHLNETKKKANKIMELKIRNKETEKNKIALKNQKDDEIKKKNEMIYMYKVASKENSENNKKALLAKLQNDVASIKKIKEETKNLNELIQNEENQKNKDTVQSIKNKELELSMKKKKMMEEKIQMAKKSYEEKIQRELEVAEAKQREIERLEAREFELIKKLQNTENLQRKAEEELQKAANYDFNLENEAGGGE